LQALERVRHRGYAVDDEEMEIGTRCVGAPIFNAEKRPIAALSISASTTRLDLHRIPTIADHVMRCCREISLELGFGARREQV
jgi:DNA-binding IclR family transcriptional regulator